MNKEIIKKMSIRGRFAYCLNLIETSMNSVELNDISLVLDKLWLFTEMQYLDDWQDKAVEFLPSSILENEFYDSDNFEYLTKQEFELLRPILVKMDKVKIDLFEHLYSLGTVELYGGLGDYAKESLKEFMQIIDIANKNNLKLPAINDFTAFTFNKRNGWGDFFEKADIKLSS